MKKRKPNFELGTFLRIPLVDGTFGYGRILEYPFIAFYDFHTTEPSLYLDEIESKPLLFTQAVRLSKPNRWVNIGKRSLRGDVTKPITFFLQDLADFQKCVIYDSTGMRREATPEECIGLEIASVWEMQDIEERIFDHFMGRPNEAETLFRVRLS